MDSDVKLVMTNHGRGELFIGGAKVPNVRSLKIECGVGEVNTVCVTFMPQQIEIEGVFDVTTIEDDAARYKRGGVPDDGA